MQKLTLPQGKVVPATIEAFILASAGRGVAADDVDAEVNRSKESLKTFLTFVQENNLVPDEAVMMVDIEPRRINTLRIGFGYATSLWALIGTYEFEGETYEYITDVLRWLPGPESIRPEEHLLIEEIPEYLDEDLLVSYLVRHGLGEGNTVKLRQIIDDMVHDYPVGNSTDYPRLYMSRLFRLDRVVGPNTNNFADATGHLAVNVMVTDKGVWGLAGQVNIWTGWRAVDDQPKWVEKVAVVERDSKIEPSKGGADPALQPGVYRFIQAPAAANAGLTGDQMGVILRHHIGGHCGETLTNCLAQLQNPQINPMARGPQGPISFMLHRLGLPGLVNKNKPHSNGLIYVDARLGDRFVGRVELHTRFEKPTGPATIKHPAEEVRVDFIEKVRTVAIHQDTLRTLQDPANFSQRHSGFGRWGGDRWTDPRQQPFGMPPPAGQYGQWQGGMHPQHQWGLGPTMLTPMTETTVMTTMHLEHFKRVLSALTEPFPTVQRNTVNDILQRIYNAVGNINPQQHGRVFFQFDFNPMHGLMIRMASESGVVHLQQVVHG